MHRGHKFAKRMLLFRKAYAATKREVFTSLYILLVFKGILTILLWIAESSLNSDYSLFDALVWIVVKYISDPAENSIKLHKRFRRIKETDSYYLNAKGLKMMFRGVPRYRTFPHIKMKTVMTEEHIMEAVNNCLDGRFQLR